MRDNTLTLCCPAWPIMLKTSHAKVVIDDMNIKNDPITEPRDACNEIYSSLCSGVV